MFESLESRQLMSATLLSTDTMTADAQPTTSVDGGSATLGSQSSGAGAGKVTFNPFSITRKIDKSSPILF